MPKLKYSEELKLKVIHYLMEGHSLIEAEREFHIGKQNIQKWRDAYELHGVKGILIKQNNHNKYTGDFKVYVIEYKQMHQLSLRRERRGKAGYEAGTMKGKKRTFKPKSEVETLQEENQRLRMENEYLKKLNALIQEREKSKKQTK